AVARPRAREVDPLPRPEVPLLLHDLRHRLPHPRLPRRRADDGVGRIRQGAADRRRRLRRAVGGARAHRHLFPLLPAHAVVHGERSGEARAGAGDVVMKRLFALLLAIPLAALAEGHGVALDPAPGDIHDKLSLQRGAAIFVNHCLNCHSASVMRYQRLTDLGLSESQIRDNLLFTGEKVGETMTAAVDPKIAKAAFGVVPPDLALAARS